MTATTRDILRFLLRTILAGVVVLLPFIIWYAVADPFKVLKHYDEYYDDPALYNARIGLNKGMVTVKTYQNNLQQGYSYNAFIFGSSLSCYYDANEWKNLIISSDTVERTVSPYHFDSASETPMSMARKVEYLQRDGTSIDYALMILDPLILGGKELDTPFAIDPVEFNPGLLHFIKYHYTFFRASSNADFLKNYIAAKITGRGDNIGHNPIFEVQPIIHNRHINEESIPQWDSLITVNPGRFYLDNPLVAPKLHATPGPTVITGERRSAFEKIAGIFNELKTDYHIIISPNRRGVSLSPADLQTLQSIFNPSRIHDFSTILAPDLQVDTLLYDNTHYRPPFASKMMRAVYSKSQL
ncbi:MAG: hypothetical protein K2L93_01470 [Muribaculaceae bacterium]|nr:hypothetical protein [Muribaculaceae bacterium]MDE6320947.1 hypothetical protein [Muribaculaceae bacterium]